MAWCAWRMWRPSRMDSVPQWTRVTADGRQAVLLNIYQQPGGNSVQIARQIKAKLDTIPAADPQGGDHRQLVRPEPAGDSRRPPACATRSSSASGLAALVLLLFLRNLKITLIAILVVPAVLAADGRSCSMSST